MRKIKKFVAMFMSVISLFVINTSAFASNDSLVTENLFDESLYITCYEFVNLNEDDIDTSDVIENNVYSWANKDYAQSSNKDKIKILKARSMILQQSDWVADGFIGYYTAPDGTVERVPNFSELFPNWDVEQIWAYNNAIKTDAYHTANSLDVFNETKDSASLCDLVLLDKNFSCNVPAATGSMAPVSHYESMKPFSPTDYITTVRSLNNSVHCNIGYVIDTWFLDAPSVDIDAGYKNNIPVGGSFGIYQVSGYDSRSVLKIRVSTYSTQGNGTFNLNITQR